MTLDLQKTQLQEVGAVFVGGFTLAQITEIVTDIGLDLDEVVMTMGGWIEVKRSRLADRAS